MRRSDTMLKGMGEEVIKIRAGELRDIAELPDEVQIVAVMPAPASHQDCGWPLPERNVMNGNYVLEEERFVYVLVRSRYAVRRPPRCQPTITDMDEFLQRWNQMWSEKK